MRKLIAFSWVGGKTSHLQWLLPIINRIEVTEFTVEGVPGGTEIHFGAEYTWLRGDTPIPLRFGAYFEPDHDGIADVDSSQRHLTFGAGVVFSERFQLDGAVNIAENVQEALFSFVFRIG